MQARKELREETGFDANRWEPVGRFASWNGVTNEICRLYIARDLVPAEAAPDPTEEFEIVRCSWDEARRLVERNEIFDGMTLASIALARSVLEGAGAGGDR